MKRITENTAILLCVATVIVVMAACSTTKRLPQGETLYTGVKKFDVVPEEGTRLPAGLMENLNTAIDYKPNNPMPFMSPFKRTPFPIGLWVYNNWNDSAGGIKGWLYRKLVSQPRLISDARPEMRVKLMEQILDNNGYFGSHASYDIVYDKKNNRKAAINYTVQVARPYPIDSVIYFNDNSTPIYRFIDSVARKSPYLKKGEIFSVDSLAAERVRIANAMRNRGYYYFRPEYVEFLADSLITPGAVALKMTLADEMPKMARLQYRTGNIITTVLRKSDSYAGTPDTMHTAKGEVIVMRPAKLRKNLIPSCITFRKGKLFSVRDMNRTQTRLSRLGIFGNIQIQPVPVDTVPGHALLDVYNIVQFDDPIEASIEVNATSKSNSYLGPGLILGITNRNMFGGGEKLNVQLNANYEWQTGRNRSSVFNSYEFGINATLAFPRMLAPRFIKRIERDLNWTTISLGASVLNRPKFFKLADFNTGITYEWRYSRHVLNQLTPFKLTYNKLISTTHDFDSIMALNPAIALSFQSQFIPQLSYTYTYDRFFERERINGINFQATVTEAGNLFNGIWTACGVKGEKRLFGTPFSQFIKGQVQLVYNRRLIRNTDHWLVSRVLIGAEHAYGNSREVPYSEQFYIGGANSIRAFTVRSIGPGSYREPDSQRNGYFDQTGTFKLELNTEYRFPIISVLHGAVFLDAGNIWLLKNDPLRPGGQLRGKTFFKDLALGTGVGLRVDIGMMVIRGDLGYGLHAPYDTGSPRYFNIKFKDAFAFHLAIGYPF
ncbi:MAG: BamA/TamA family outer membrane protein [Bacteroidales bacterium]|nr:BamA/TamA family outer membrane protein [Bacteroidales bacterium]